MSRAMPPPSSKSRADGLAKRVAHELALTRLSSPGGLISDLSHIEFQLLSRSLAKYGISGASWYYMRHLWEEDGISQRELGRRNGVNDASSKAAIHLMEKQKLVVRKMDSSDRRMNRVFLTSRGKRLKKALLPIALELNDVMMSGFSADEKNTFLDLLRRAYRNLMAEK